MKFGVVVFPGSNCDDDMIHVLGTVMQQEVVKLWHKETELSGFGKGDCIVLPGGFSYGDYLRAGAIARFSPIMKSVIEFANNGGYVLGVCNGFQVACEAGLLPGVLLRNSNQKFICKNVHLKTLTNNAAITSNINLEQPLLVPIAHAEGRYLADDDTLKSLELKLATPLLDVDASSPDIVIVGHVPFTWSLPFVSIPSPPTNLRSAAFPPVFASQLA